MRTLRRKAFATTAALLGLLGLTAGLRANDLTTGLVAYYPLDGNASDMSGNGRDGTSAAGQAPIAGSDRHGGLQKAYFFDGVNDKVNLGTLNSTISGQDKLTVWAWVSHSSTGDDRILCKSPSTNISDHIFSLGINGSDLLIMRIGTNTTNATSMVGSAVIPSNGTWTQVAMTYDGSKVRSYVNGALDSHHSLSGNIKSSSDNVYIGNVNGGQNRHFLGKIDELRIYDRALSASDVQALYNLENTPPNQSPSFSGPASFTTAENNASATFQPTASDPDGDGLTYQIFGGADHTKFDINASTGSITFKTTPDFENPSDSNADNAYRVRVRVSDGNTYTNRIFTIHVTDLNEVPSFSGPAIFTTPENNASATFQPTASDPDGNNLTYQISGGADQSKFDINASTGSITFKTTPDFENPSDSNADNAYRVRVRISDGTANANRIFTIHVTDLNETPPNTAPTDLNSTATLSIAENQPVGTLVGQFTATDPDVGATLSYRLTGGQGSQHNDRFTLDANGTLKTATTFDYETNASTYSIRVQVKDEHNATAEGNFTVTLTDVYEPPPDQTGVNENNSTNENNATTGPVDSNSTVETNSTQPTDTESFRPIVDTRPAENVMETSATLRGKIEDNGGSAVTGRGFLLSTRPNPKPGRKNVTRLDANGSKNFQAQATNLKAGKKYFYRAFATNAKGTSLGPVETFTTTTATQGPSWINAKPGVAADWWRSPWFGNFFLNANGWARHEKLGWIYPVESPTAGLWLWKKDLGWLWTDKGIYPFLFDNARGGWLYFYGNYEKTTLFYDYGRKRWITTEEN